jgi:outer membrane biosynthesis protein TonB
LLLFWLVASIELENKKSGPQEKKIKISLKELPKKYKDSGLTKQKLPEPEIAPPMPKGKQLEKIIKEEPLNYEPQKDPVIPKLNKPKHKQETPKELVKKVEPLPQKPYIPLIDTNTTTAKKEKETKQKKSPLYSLLAQDHSDQEEKKQNKNTHSGSSISSNIKELYGEEFGKLSQGQQKYILDNQEIMRRITQQVLNRVARVNIPYDLNVNKINVIEFYLHPNGDMTDFRFLKKSEYYILDETTKETIEYAYSRYPRPSEKTLIRYNVYYNLARY